MPSKNNIYLLVIFFLIIVLLAINFLISNKNPITQAVKSNPRNVYLGFWTDGFWDNKTKQINPVKLRELEKKIGKKVAIAHYFRGWEFLAQPDLLTDVSTISKEGWIPMISPNPYFFSQCESKGKLLYEAIAAGNCDEFLHAVGKNLSKINSPLFLRFAWEMNVKSIEWSVGYTRSTPESFINAWRHFHDILKVEGAKNVVWVFAPQITTPTTTDVATLYPGDAYVDWVALDGYNWGSTKSWSNWQNFQDVYLNSYKKIIELAPTKPLMISEVNTADKGGDKAAWFTNMLTNQIPNVFTNVDAVVFFNENKLSIEGVDWTIDASPNYLDAFRAAIKNPIYKSVLKPELLQPK